jgi:hypothetical protein
MAQIAYADKTETGENFSELYMPSKVRMFHIIWLILTLALYV